MTRGPKERGRGAGWDHDLGPQGAWQGGRKWGPSSGSNSEHLLSALSKDREARAEVQVLTAVSLPPSHNCLCFNFLTCEQWGEDLPSKLL